MRSGGAVRPGAGPQAASPVNYDTLKWHLESHGGKAALTARLPLSQLQQFVEGEGERCGCCFSRRSNHPGKPEDPFVNYITYNCVHGPEDLTEPELVAKAAAREGIQRRGCRAAGQSAKVGCKAGFSITVNRGAPDTAVIRYKQVEHTGHEGRQAPRLSPGVRQWLEWQLRLNPAFTATELMAMNTRRFLAPLQAEHPEWAPEKARSPGLPRPGTATSPQGAAWVPGCMLKCAWHGVACACRPSKAPDPRPPVARARAPGRGGTATRLVH